MAPNQICPKDGQKRKQKCIGDCTTHSQIREEVLRNTDERSGEVLLQGLCHQCHRFKDGNLMYKHAHGTRLVRQMQMNAYKRSIGVCQYEKCSAEKGTELCEEGVECLFQLDHLHPKSCRCGNCDGDQNWRKKLESVSVMVVDNGKWSQSVFEGEMCQEKVRLMHTRCHWEHTSIQNRGMKSTST